jgi:sialate O-acetylesterase
MRKISLCYLFVLLSAFCLPGRADVRLPALLDDHMVVQRDLPVHFWGDAEPGEQVSVAFRGETRAVVADKLGRWSIHLPPGKAGGPFEAVIQGANMIMLHDILVGDVWVASGQSNMELPLSLAADPAQEIAGADCPNIRFFQALHRASDYPLDMIDRKDVRPWVVCSPDKAAEFSAVAYHFARQVQKSTGVPIGIVQSFWGGTAAESWTSLRGLSSDAGLIPVFAYRARMSEERAAFLRQSSLAQAAYQRAVARGQAAGLVDPSQRWHPEFEAWAPAALFNAMIAPLTPFPMRGVIWYQGEANSEPLQHPIYEQLFTTLISDWRRAWGQGDFPFLYVQLANYNLLPPDWHWPEVREAQRRSLRVTNTAMVVTIDIGDARAIHPKNKKEVGARLALAARALSYGELIEYSGPQFRQVIPEAASLRLYFDHAAGGLQVKGPSLRGFEIAGEDRSYVSANAVVEGECVIVSSPKVPTPKYVRYAWAANPVCDLYNNNNLPASPFTSER